MRNKARCYGFLTLKQCIFIKKHHNKIYIISPSTVFLIFSLKLFAHIIMKLIKKPHMLNKILHKGRRQRKQDSPRQISVY